MERLPNARLLLPTALALLLAIFATSTSTAAPAASGARPDFRLAQVRGVDFQAPVWVGSAPGSGSTYYVVEQRGIVWAVTGSRKRIFVDLRRVVKDSGEQGLLSIAFASDYARSGRLLVYFVARDGNGQVRQLRARRGRVVAGSSRLVIRVPLAPPSATNHNGGNLWTTKQGQLFLSIGDGGGDGAASRNSQRMNLLMGKLIRITPRANGGYVIPRSNPFFRRSGARREIYALGLRNPWRFSIDEPTGDIWIGDVGQSAREEIDRLPGGRPAGANFGWPRTEGNRIYSNAVRLAGGTRWMRPLLDYGRADGACSVTGGVVYRGPIASLRGRYLYADFCDDEIWSTRPGSRFVLEHDAVRGIVHFGTVAGGNVMVASVTTGKLYRILAA